MKNHVDPLAMIIKYGIEKNMVTDALSEWFHQIVEQDIESKSPEERRDDLDIGIATSIILAHILATDMIVDFLDWFNAARKEIEKTENKDQRKTKQETVSPV